MSKETVFRRFRVDNAIITLERNCLTFHGGMVINRICFETPSVIIPAMLEIADRYCPQAQKKTLFQILSRKIKPLPVIRCDFDKNYIKVGDLSFFYLKDGKVSSLSIYLHEILRWKETIICGSLNFLGLSENIKFSSKLEEVGVFNPVAAEQSFFSLCKRKIDEASNNYPLKISVDGRFEFFEIFITKKEIEETIPKTPPINELFETLCFIGVKHYNFHFCFSLIEDKIRILGFCRVI